MVIHISAVLETKKKQKGEKLITPEKCCAMHSNNIVQRNGVLDLCTHARVR